MESTTQIAARLAALCGQGQFEKAQKELFADDVISIEPEASPAFAKEQKGLAAIIAKGHQFEGMVEKIHGIKVSDPLVTGNCFAFTLSMDITMKGQGRANMDELCVYQVKDGKVVSEQFFM
ncbi:MAG TPA: nuclear transport factor 2 family protein [Chitinophagaceae bacterium]|nr:nuclear transport factor 2 family protein [Chitinophagaceae bacterium]